ncbi:MAG: hypothetical protein U5L72_16020 [Bacteroidales bacterium]|nr:hypothetical protein [Bacteroidales bacterium]
MTGFPDPGQAEFMTCFFDPSIEASLANNDAHYIDRSRSDEIYVATFGGGLNRVINSKSSDEKPAFRSYTVKTGAPDHAMTQYR